MKQLLLSLWLVCMATACIGGQRNAEYVDGLHVRKQHVCERNAIGGENCVTKIDERTPYNDCLIDHPNDRWICEQGAGNGWGYGAASAAIAPPGPNVWASPGGPIQTNYAIAASGQQASSTSSGVSRDEYNADKTKNESQMRGLYKQVAKDKKRIDALESEGDPTSK